MADPPPKAQSINPFNTKSTDTQTLLLYRGHAMAPLMAITSISLGGFTEEKGVRDRGRGRSESEKGGRRGNESRHIKASP